MTHVDFTTPGWQRPTRALCAGCADGRHDDHEDGCACRSRQHMREEDE